jgi:hypothetical protein
MSRVAAARAAPPPCTTTTAIPRSPRRAGDANGRQPAQQQCYSVNPGAHTTGGRLTAAVIQEKVRARARSIVQIEGQKRAGRKKATIDIRDRAKTRAHLLVQREMSGAIPTPVEQATGAFNEHLERFKRAAQVRQRTATKLMATESAQHSAARRRMSVPAVPSLAGLGDDGPHETTILHNDAVPPSEQPRQTLAEMQPQYKPRNAATTPADGKLNIVSPVKFSSALAAFRKSAKAANMVRQRIACLLCTHRQHG